MANAMAANMAFHADKAKAPRKKAPEACGRCREKRIKCNGLQPCDQCYKKDIPCVFAYAPLGASGGQEALAEKLDLVLSRLDRIEEEMCRQANRIASNPDLNLQRQRKHPPERRSSGVAQLNEQTGCFEYYGQTSTFMVASFLDKRLRQLDDVMEGTPPAKQRRSDPNAWQEPPNNEGSDSLGLKDLTGFCDYIVPLNDLRGDRYLREPITDRHLDSFFSTIHIFLPFLDPIVFRARYKSLRQLFGDRRLFLPTLDDPRRPQFVCLLYAVLALGALYENERDDSSAWASWYFAEAQEMLGRLLNSSNIQLVQAAMLLGAYAQHTIKPNLAYILNGVATRLAFSTGLNVELLHSSLGVDAQEARRTWWVIYIQEVELSLDAGRPMSLRTSEMNMGYPTVKLPVANEPVPDSAQVNFIMYLAEFAKIIRRIIRLSAEAHESSEPSPLKLDQREALRQEVGAWRASLPAYLSFPDFTERAYDSCDQNFLYDWKMRQQSSLQIHYHLANIILLRGSVVKKTVDHHALNTQQLSSLHQSAYLDAARDMIRHIHKLFILAPGLRRWSYYCFYCLQATLVLLHKVADDQHSRRRQRHAQNQPESHSSFDAGRETVEEDRKICQLAFEVFEFIKLKASQRCADVVRQFLDKTSSASRRARGPELSTPSSLISGHAGLPQNVHSFPNTRDRPSGAESVGSVEGSSSTSPPISLNGLHDDLFDAFYRSDMGPAFNFSHSQPFLDTASPRNAPSVVGLEGVVTSDWMSGSAPNPHSLGWSIE
ncbi:transcriptional regulatory protein [Paramyrothecium foliicola]|nr:transcriptional regulatory protein [Paramyrothecium foliicola]